MTAVADAASMPRPTRAERRAVKRARANARVKAPIPEALRAKDPLRHAKRASAALAFLLIAGALSAHVLVIGGLWATGSAIRALSDRLPNPKDRVIELTVIEPPPPPPEPPPPPPEPEPEPEPEAEPESKPKPKPKPKPKAPPPPPDPIDVPDDPPPPPPPSDKPPPRRIVGLSLESTVKGGGGPSFAVGNTRMGETEKKAANPDEAKPLPKTAPKPPPKRVNRVATRVPTDECKLVKPRPRGARLEPVYPKEYEAQLLAAELAIELRIGKDGRVLDAKIKNPSPHPKFNDNALKAVKRQRFTPAACKGKPGTERELTITYSVIFKLPD